MLTETTGRTPEDLAAELRDELAVDWIPLWKQMPWAGYPDFKELCEKHGWEPDLPVHERGGMDARSRTGAKLYFYLRPPWGGVWSLSHYGWRLETDDPAENGAVVARAEQDWPAYLAAAESVLGAPTWTGPWDAPDFPEPPYPAYWSSRQARLETRHPYALAYWKPADDAPGRPHITLTQSVTFPTWTTTAPGASHLGLDLWAPAEYLEPRS